MAGNLRSYRAATLTYTKRLNIIIRVSQKSHMLFISVIRDLIREDSQLAVPRPNVCWKKLSFRLN